MVELHLAQPSRSPTPAELDAVFHALADSTRRGMLRSLARRQHSISELAAPYAMSFAAASKHVKALERAGLVRREVKGRTHLCHLEKAAMQQAEAWIAEQRALWEGRLDRLDAYLLALHARQQEEEAAASAAASVPPAPVPTAETVKPAKENE